MYTDTVSAKIHTTLYYRQQINFFSYDVLLFLSPGARPEEARQFHKAS